MSRRSRSRRASQLALAPKAAPPAARSIAATVAPYTAGRPQWLQRGPESMRTEALEKLALIFRCVQFTANAAGHSGVTLRVYDELADGDREEVKDHPLRLLMRQPNPRMREGRFLTFVTMVAASSSFCVIEKVRSAEGRVVALEPLLTEWLRPILRDQAACDWEYKIPGISPAFTLSSTDVIAFTYADRPDARLQPTGYGPVEACFREVGLLNVMTDFLKVFFDRGAMPVYGVMLDALPGSPAMPQADKDAMADAFIARRGGLLNGAMPIVLEGVKGIQRLSFDFNELALTAIRDMSDIAICQAFGIDPGLVGTRVGMEHSDARANATEASRKFYRDVMIPLWNRLDEALSIDLLPEFEAFGSTRELAFDYSDVHALQQDRNAKSSWVNTAFASGGITQYMFCDEMGLPRPETPDFYLRPIATEAIPAEDPLMAPPPPAAPPALPPGKTPKAMPMSAGAPAERLAARDASKQQIANIARARQPSIQRFLSEQRDRLAAAVAQGRAIALASSNGHGPRVKLAVQIDWEHEEQRLAQTMKPLQLLAGQTAYTQASTQLGMSIDFNLANPAVRSVMAKLALRVTDISQTTQDDIAELITQGEENGSSLDEIATSIRGLFDETYSNRAETIARTESMYSMGLASSAAFKESGVVDRIQCFDNPEHTQDYGAADGLSCAERDLYIDDLDSAELHLESEHPNGSLSIAPVLAGDN